MNKEEIDYIIELLEKCIADDIWFEINNDNATLLGSYINTLEQENKQLKEQLGKLLGLNEDELWLAYNKEVLNLQKENIEFEERIDKAIEYIEYNNEDLYTFEPDYDYEEELVDNYEPSNYREDLLEILKGE